MSFTDQIKEYRDRLDAVTSAVKWVEHQSQQAPGTMSSQDKLQAALLILEAFYPPTANLVPLINAVVAVFNLARIFKKS